MRFQIRTPCARNKVETMLEAFKIAQTDSATATETIVLSYEERKKSRHRTETTSGKALGWFLERGHVLENDEILECSDGTLIKVEAAEESVSEVISNNAHALTRAAYHLGNRHVPLQVSDGFLRYLHDHVLDEMVVGLGLAVTFAKKPFHPENGAYAPGTGGHHHGHEH